MKLEFCLAFADRPYQNSPGTIRRRARTCRSLGLILNNEDLRERCALCYVSCLLFI